MRPGGEAGSWPVPRLKGVRVWPPSAVGNATPRPSKPSARPILAFAPPAPPLLTLPPPPLAPCRAPPQAAFIADLELTAQSPAEPSPHEALVSYWTEQGLNKVRAGLAW